MIGQPVEYLGLIERDLRNARAYYDTWRTNGAFQFSELFWETISWIEWNPELFPLKYRFFRRAILRKSYYAIYYVVEPKVTTVVAVLDMRRNPKTIRAMLGHRWQK